MTIQTIGGQVCRGYQIASGQAADSPHPDGSIALQIPVFKRLGLNLADLHPATLNLDISPFRFQLTQADYQFNQVKWLSGVEPENFSFVACQLTWQERDYTGYLYYPHPETKPDHFHDDRHVEVICQWIPDIHYGDRVTLTLDKSKVKLWRG